MGAVQMSATTTTTTTTTKPAAKDPPIYTLQIPPQPHVEAIRPLRKALKILTKDCALRCVSIEEHHNGQKEPTSDSATPAVRAAAQSGSAPRAADRGLRLAAKLKRSSRSARKREGRAHISHTQPGLATSRLPRFSH